MNLIVLFVRLMKIYHHYWIIEAQMQDPKEDINWLINDIIAYANNDIATMYGYNDHFYNIFNRMVMLRRHGFFIQVDVVI